MKKGEVLALALIGTMFVGLTLVAFGNPIGAFVVAGVIMLGSGL
jgi:hypothetical protein